MAARTPRVALTDIRDAIRRINRYTREHTSRSFEADEMARDAVERCIEIISEASRKIPAPLKAAPLIWEIVVEHLPPLRRAVNAMLRQTGVTKSKRR